MSRWSEREIARKLAERDELEPPPGLLEKIKSEIPPMIPARTGLPEIDRRPSMPPRQRWLIAASLVAMIGAGLFALIHQREAPTAAEYAAPAFRDVRQSKRRQVLSSPAPAAPAKPAPESQRSFEMQRREAPAAKQQLQKKEQEELKALGYVGSPDEKKTERGAASEGSPNSVAGGETFAPPAAAAPPAAPPVAAPPPPPAEGPAVQAAPLLDGRRAEERDRINVGGNESGRQDLDKGPGIAGRLQSAPATRAKAAGAGLLWKGPSAQVTLETDTDTFSYDLVRRSIAEGKLPDPAVVRIGEIVNAFETGDAPRVEGASTPFVHGPQSRLLRIHPGGASPARVTFNPAVVVRYRWIGTGVSALYEIELRPDVSSQDAMVAALHTGDQMKAVVLADLDASWHQASPGFRLAALAAEFAEILKGSPVDSSALHRLSAEIGKLPKGPKAAELGELVEKAGKIR